MQKIYYTSFPTPIGRMFFAATKQGICRVSWEYGSEKDFVKEVRSRESEVKSIVRSNAHFRAVKNDILKYLSGRPVSFKKYTVVLKGTDFQKRVWRALADIPYGTVLTYGEVAERVAAPKAFRAVGGACGANELPIVIPCHRVIAGSGGLGGFSGGLRLKRHLLQLEGVKLK